MADKYAYSDSMNRLIDAFATLPGIGRRTAERLAFHVLKTSKDEALTLAKAISDVKTNVRHCSVCYNLTETDPCSVCSDARRDHTKILVVEQPKDVIILEQAHSYDGVYHVLLGHLSPLENIRPTDLTIDALLHRLRTADAAGEDVEVILGLNPNMEGDGTALYIAGQAQGLSHVKISRLARGLPAGSQLEYANKAVLSDAITGRQKMT
jgi:recombination protein RecR